MLLDSTPSYWMNVPLKIGSKQMPRDGGIAVIGAGISGVSIAYWLSQKGFKDITLIDFEPEKAATLRNCGHILHGSVESMQALVALHGAEVAKEIWHFSVSACLQLQETILRHKIVCDYAQDGYLVLAIDAIENQELINSTDYLVKMGFSSQYLDSRELSSFGFRNVFGGRFDPGSAQAHPVKFRNALLEIALTNGVSYHTGWKVTEVEENGDHVLINLNHEASLKYDFAVIAANAYSPLLSKFYKQKQLIEPFRGQIITSAPLQHKFSVRYPHSFDHGYEYALVTEDNRLMIGGWRNHTPGGELGTYDIIPNPLVEAGLKEFVRNHYDINESIRWDYSWAGIMAASQTGFPFIGPTNDHRIFTCAGYTGHGFSWAHGSAKLLADIMNGDEIPPVARHFDPRR